MKHIVLFSGGIQSSYVAYLVSQQEKKDVILLFHDTKTEPPDNYRFRREVSSFLNVPITEQSDGRNIWQVFDDEHFLGNNRVPVCSFRLKIDQGEKYYQTIDDEYTIYYGFGPGEYRRAQKIISRYPNRNILFPLLNDRIYKDRIIKEITSEWQICLPEMYQHFSHANCIPCVRGTQGHWTQIYRHHRNEYERAKEYETKFGYTIMPKISLQEFQEAIEENMQLNFEEDTLPCICATG